jgi:hypothetical protein
MRRLFSHLRVEVFWNRKESNSDHHRIIERYPRHLTLCMSTKLRLSPNDGGDVARSQHHSIHIAEGHWLVFSIAANAAVRALRARISVS